MPRGDLFDAVGVTGGTVELNGKTQEVVGIEIPSFDPEGEAVLYLTLTAAKSLLIDLRDVIQHCEKHAAEGE